MKHEPVRHSPCRVQSVMVIDDHPLYCDALATTLRHAFPSCHIETASTLCDGLNLLTGDFTPDMVMLDLRLPDVTGISGYLRLRDRLPDTPIVVISALTSADVVHTLMDAGAAGFVPKDISSEVLQEALCEVSMGRRYLPKDHRQSYRPAARAAALHDVSWKIAELTPQQTRIMKLICAGKPNKQIAYELSLAEATVKAHITALLRRLGVQNRTQAAMLVESANLEGESQSSDAAARAFLSQ